MEDDKLFNHLYGICIELKYIWPTMRKDMNEIIKNKPEISEVHQKSRMLHVSEPPSITSTSHNCEEKIKGQTRNGGESPRQSEPNTIVSELPLVRTTPIRREKVLGKKTGRPPQNLKLLLAGVQKVKCIMRYSSNCFGEFIPHSKFNKICNNCKSTHAYRSYV